MQWNEKEDIKGKRKKKKKEKERKKEKFQLGSKHFVDDKEFNMNSECD